MTISTSARPIQLTPQKFGGTSKTQTRFGKASAAGTIPTGEMDFGKILEFLKALKTEKIPNIKQFNTLITDLLKHDVTKKGLSAGLSGLSLLCTFKIASQRNVIARNFKLLHILQFAGIPLSFAAYGGLELIKYLQLKHGLDNYADPSHLKGDILKDNLRKHTKTILERPELEFLKFLHQGKVQDWVNNIADKMIDPLIEKVKGFTDDALPVDLGVGKKLAATNTQAEFIQELMNGVCKIGKQAIEDGWFKGLNILNHPLLNFLKFIK
jgi:hypothetical protein